MEYTGFRPEAESPDHGEAELSLDRLLCRRITFFAMMRGHAMSRAKIHHGDLLVIQPEETYRDGQIVLALVDRQALVRKLERTTDGGFELHATSSKYPVLVAGEDCLIRGRVVASITLLARPKIPLPVVS